jgi:YesN/AraC family two-component response regulator
MFYITDGEIVIELPNETLLATAGDLVLIPTGTKHDFHLSPLKRASKYWMHFTVTSNNRNFFDYYTLPYKMHIGENTDVAQLFESVLLGGQSEEIADHFTATGSLCRLLAFYVEHAAYTKNIDGDEIDAAIEYIKTHYEDKFELDDLVAHVSLSKGYLIKKFKQRTGQTPMQYALTLKIDKAKMLIEQTSLPIAAIMEDLGFFDSAHFSKVFKAYTGDSPKAFRQKNGYRKANSPFLEGNRSV